MSQATSSALEAVRAKLRQPARERKQQREDARKRRKREREVAARVERRALDEVWSAAHRAVPSTARMLGRAEGHSHAGGRP